MKGLIYTALFGGRDKPLAVRAPEGNVDYLMFTDSRAPKGWEEVLCGRSAHSRLEARLRKVVLPPQADGYDWAMWVDASHVPQVPIASHVERWLESHEFAAYRHHHWDCSYKEIEMCKRLGKDKAVRLDFCAEKLRSAAFPEHYGQIASTILARRVESHVVASHAHCWKMWIELFSIRDQVSFMHCLRDVTGAESAEEHLHYIGPNAFRNELFHYQGGH